MSPIKEDLDRYAEVTGKLIDALDKIPSVTGANTNGVNVSVNAGGIGVLIICVLAAFVTGLFIVLLFIVFKQGTDIASLHDYLSAIYMQAPSLRPKE